MAAHEPGSQLATFSAGGALVVEPQPDERAFALRQADFLTLCEGEVFRSDERWRDTCIAIFWTGVVATISFSPTVDWSTAFQKEKYAPFAAGFVLCFITGVSFVLWQFFRVRCTRQVAPSAYSRLKKKIEDYFTDPDPQP